MPLSQGNPFMSLVPMIGIFIIFYFLLIKPQKAKEQEHQNMLKTLAKNDDIVTSGGIHGTIVNVKDTTVIVRVDDNVKLEIEKTSVSHVTKKAG